MLETSKDYQRSDYNNLKVLPKNPTISNFKELILHHDWLASFGDMKKQLRSIIPIKLTQLAQQARSLDASNVKDFSESKRYTLILCLISQAQTQAKDALALTCCRTIMKMHKDAKNKLENLREHYRYKTQELLGIFSEFLGGLNQSLFTSIDNVTSKMNEHGGAESLKVDCDYAVALNSNLDFGHIHAIQDSATKNNCMI